MAELKQQLSSLEERHSELKASHKQQQLTIRQQQARLAVHTPEQLTLQAEMDKLRKCHHKEMLVLEYDNKQLRRQLAGQAEYVLQLQRRLDEQLIHLKAAQREVQDLHSLIECGKGGQLPCQVKGRR